ncbi:MAG TPA: nitroreductase family protein [Desulfatiglandales bacterium]|nr:nitroreductase family protein [Desulfatiglandales bacterium]
MTEKNFNFPDNETFRTIKERHSIRLFTERDVPDSYIKAILHAANQAPSAHNQQSWRFVVVRGRKKIDLVHLVFSRAEQFPKPSSALLRMAARSMQSAPVVIAIANTGKLISRGTKLLKIRKDMAYDFFRTMEIQSSSAAVENLLLAATSLGLATVWLGILFLIKNEVLHFLGEPQGEFMAVVPVGFAYKPTSGPKKMALDKVVRWLD